MHRLIIIFCINLVSMTWSQSYANDAVGPSVFVGGNIGNPNQYPYLSDKESLAELLNRAGGLHVTLDDIKKYRSGEPAPHVSVNLYRNGKKQEFRIDPKSSQLWNLKVQKNDVIEVVRDPLYFGDLSSTLKLSKPNDEQPGAVQPATKPADKAAGRDQPSPPTSKDGPGS